MNTFGEWCRRRLMGVLRRVGRHPELNPEDIDADDIQRILVIRSHDALSDLLLATPVFRALRRRWPDAYIALLTRRDWVPYVENNVHLDQVIGVEAGPGKWTPAQLVRLWRRLRPGYDLAVVLNTVSHPLGSDLLACFSRARYILGSESPPLPGMERPGLYHLVAPEPGLNEHDSERNLDIVRYVGADEVDLHEEMHLSLEQREQGRAFLASHGLAPDDFLVGFFLSPGPSAARMDVAKLAQVAKYFSSRCEARILVAADPGDEAAAAHFNRALPFSPVDIGQLERPERMTVVYYCDFLVCYDNVIMHLAAAMGVPLVAIFGANDPFRRKPMGPEFMAVTSEAGDTTKITAEEIIDLGWQLCQSHPKTARWRFERLDISESVLQDYLNTLSRLEED